VKSKTDRTLALPLHTDDNYVHIRDEAAIGRKAIDNFRKGWNKQWKITKKARCSLTEL
jgi:hypothetical protein